MIIDEKRLQLSQQFNKSPKTPLTPLNKTNHFTLKSEQTIKKEKEKMISQNDFSNLKLKIIFDKNIKKSTIKNSGNKISSKSFISKKHIY